MVDLCQLFKKQMNKHKCVLCLGTNFEKYTSIQNAREQLSQLFPNIRFSEEMITEAIGQHLLSPFINQIGIFSTELSAKEITEKCKNIEHFLGRKPEYKSQGIVKIDIDLLSFDQLILKPKDMERDFVLKGIQNLQS